jgi:hypothetical protein
MKNQIYIIKRDGIIKSCQMHLRSLFQDSEALTRYIPVVRSHMNYGPDLSRTRNRMS